MADRMKKLTPENCPFEPLEDHVLLKRVRDEKTAGGILLPDSKDPKDRMLIKGTVIAVGPGRILDSGATRLVAVKPGDIVFYPLQAHSDMGMSVQKYLAELGFDRDDCEGIALLGYQNIVFKVKAS